MQPTTTRLSHFSRTKCAISTVAMLLGLLCMVDCSPSSIPTETQAEPTTTERQTNAELSLEPTREIQATPDSGTHDRPQPDTFLPEPSPENHTSGCPAWNNRDFKKLSYGLYWFRDRDTCHKHKANQPNPFYDPNQPIVIYVHGWASNSVEKGTHPGFRDNANGGPDTDITVAWKQKGWNVGIMYWDQFADEDEVKHAEAKVWSHKGPKRMRWRTPSGTYNDSDVPLGKSASDLLFTELTQALAKHKRPIIRLVGHSLGSQMVLAIGEKIVKGIREGSVPRHLLPTRIALLDPAFLKGDRDYLNNQTTGTRGRTAASILQSEGVLLEAYRSSSVTSNPFIGDANKKLLEMTAFTELKPHYFQLWELVQKHMMAKWYYFWSMSFAPPTLENPTNNGDTGASASAPDERIKRLMQSTKKLVQSKVEKTKNPNDDVFKQTSR